MANTETLNIYLADLPGKILWPSPIRVTLQQYFSRIVSKHGDVKSAMVQWTSRPPPLSDHDLLLYFVVDPDDTVVKTGLGSPNSIEADANGHTVRRLSDGLTGSEAYFSGRQNEPVMLAKLAFHELFHNVTQMDDELHGKAGLGLGRKKILSGTQLTDGDVNLMVAHLTTTKRSQWKDGFSHYHDPFRKGP